MELKMTKRRKLIFAVFVVLLIAVISAGTVGAVDYGSLPDEVLKRLTVKNIGSDTARSMKYNALCFFAKVVD